MTGQAQLDTYILCSTPRTGSTFLCELLSSTGVAGKPHSYFRSQDLAGWAAKFDSLTPHGKVDFVRFVHATRTFTATLNGVLGIRVMWGTLDEILDRLRVHFASKDDIPILQSAFGRIRFIYLYRSDLISQAISLYRAEQTDYWHSTQRKLHATTPEYDFHEINQRYESIWRDNQAWKRWFENSGVRPYSVSYESLDSDPEETTVSILRFLELDVPITRISAPNQRLADETTIEWRERFVNDLTGAT